MTHALDRKAIQARQQILSAHRKWLSKLGGNRYHPLLFVYLKEALDEVHSEMSAPCDLSDLCLLQKPKKPSAFASVKAMKEFWNLHHPQGGTDGVGTEELPEKEKPAA
jgi:hypothetical protein